MNSNRTSPSFAIPPWPITLVALFCVGWALYNVAANPLEINHDVAAYLQVATMLLEGAVPYVDVVEINPPLIWYLSIIPVEVANLTGLSAPLAAKLLLITASLLSSVAINYLLLKALAEDRVTAAVTALVPLLMLVVLDRVHEWGQREHLFALAFLPFIIIRCLRYTDRPVSQVLVFVVSVAMGFVFALKAPQFGVIWFISEAYLLFRYRRLSALFSAEIRWVALIVLLYAAHFLFLPDLSRENFFFRYIPLIAAGYSSYARPFAELIIAIGVNAVVPVTITFITIGVAYRWPTGLKKDLVVIGCLMAGVTIMVMFAQGKGWGYHAIPAWFGASFASSFWLAELLKKWSGFISLPNTQQNTDRMASLLLVTVFAVACVMMPKGYVGSVKTPFHTIETYTAKGDAVLCVGSSLLPAYPMLVQTERRAGSRFISTFPISMLYQNSTQDASEPSGYKLDQAYTEEEARFLAELASDIATKQPKLILIDARSSSRLPDGFLLPEYVVNSSELSGVLQDYSWVAAEKGFKILRLQAAAGPG
jgi:hypothetical protein